MIVLDFWDAVFLAILGLLLLWFVWATIVYNVKRIFKGREKEGDT